MSVALPLFGGAAPSGEQALARAKYEASSRPTAYDLGRIMGSDPQANLRKSMRNVPSKNSLSTDHSRSPVFDVIVVSSFDLFDERITANSNILIGVQSSFAEIGTDALDRRMT